MGFFTSTPRKVEQLERFKPDQQQASSQVLQQALSGLQPQNFGKGFEPIAQQARTQFSQQTIPSIAERFTGLGAGAQRSSAFPMALGQAGAGLEGNLAGQKAQFGLQQQGLLQNLLGMGLQPQFENLITPKDPSFMGKMANLLPMLAMMYFGGKPMPGMQNQGQQSQPFFGGSGAGQQGFGQQGLLSPNVSGDFMNRSGGNFPSIYGNDLTNRLGAF